MKVLVLIIASDGNHYNTLQIFWESYMNINKNFECYFIKADPNIEENYISNNTIYIKSEEKFDNIFYKTQQALKYFKPRFNEFNYIFRTNLSSFIFFDKYIKWLDTLPSQQVYNGYIGWHGEYPYTSGCGFTITTDIANLFIDYKNGNYVIDDVTFGKICKENNIPITTAPCQMLFMESLDREITLFNTFDKAFHFRINSPRKNEDITIYYNLLKIYYNIDINNML